jgi:membrane fusion protein (multidrug efflux system)
MRLILPAGIVSGVLLVSGCSEEAQQVELPPPSVVVATVAESRIGIRREFIGRTTATERVNLRARVSGILEAREFEEGASVNTGDLLYRIEPDPYQVQVDQAEAQLSADKARLVDAEAKYQRMEALFTKQSVSEQDRDEARAAALMAEAAVQGSGAALERARLDLSWVDLSAPIDGVIGESRVDVGNLVGPESGDLATIIRLDPIHVHFTVSDVEYLNFRKRYPDPATDPETAQPGPSVQPSLRLSDDTEYPHPGTMELIANEIDPGTGTLTLRAVFPNPDFLLRPGQFVTAVFETTRAESTIVIPQVAVLSGQAGHSVLVVGDGNIVEQRRIETGERSGNDWVVLTGLAAGERIIVRGLQKARPGEPVEPVEEDG